MAAYPPLYFTSADSAALVMSGTAGALTDILNACLIVKNVFTTPDDAGFTDRAAAARTQANAAADNFAMFPTPGTGDRTYVGMTTKFGRMFIVLGVNGIGGVYAIEYWNGSAWTAVSGLVDGTNGLTQNGVITWTMAANWAANAVNGITQYWIRFRPTSAPGTSPQITSLSVTGWTQYFAAANKYVYQQGGGNLFFMRIRDNAGGTGGAKEGLVRWFETIADIDAVGNTGPMPTVAQSAVTDNSLVIRKSTTANAAARLWACVADDRTFYLAVSTGDNGAAYYSVGMGDFFSMVPGDQYRVFLVAEPGENSGAVGNNFMTNAQMLNVAPTNQGHFVIRAYTGAGGSLTCAKHGDGNKAVSTNSLGPGASSTFPNSADGGIYLSPVWLHELAAAVGVVRGRLRGMVQFLHAQTAIADRDTFSGSGALAGRTFVKIGNEQSSGSTNCALTWDVSPTTPWESN